MGENDEMAGELVQWNAVRERLRRLGTVTDDLGFVAFEIAGSGTVALAEGYGAGMVRMTVAYDPGLAVAAVADLILEAVGDFSVYCDDAQGGRFGWQAGAERPEMLRQARWCVAEGVVYEPWRRLAEEPAGAGAIGTGEGAEVAGEVALWWWERANVVRPSGGR